MTGFPADIADIPRMFSWSPDSHKSTGCDSSAQHFAEVLPAFSHANILWWQHVNDAVDRHGTCSNRLIALASTVTCGGCSAIVVQGPVLIYLKKQLLPQRRCCLGYNKRQQSNAASRGAEGKVTAKQSIMLGIISSRHRAPAPLIL